MPTVAFRVPGMGIFLSMNLEPTRSSSSDASKARGLAGTANATENNSDASVVDIRYGQVGLVHVRVRTIDPGRILDDLTGRVAAAPHFFRRTAVCLELSALESAPSVSELQAVVDALRRAGMLAVGLAGDPDAVSGPSMALNLPVLSSFRPPTRPVPVVQPADAPARAAAPSVPAATPAAAASATAAAVADAFVPALVHPHPVRSGQRVYGRNRDLIVTAAVGAGAEVMADGCLHVYGSLRGRAMAGAHGELSARVFCQEFFAELISIAGIFRVFETIPPELAGKPVQAWLAGEDLRLARIG
ncbi:MAG TPA: septum site-determining protein MinC [Steroidobacteraceae bacterium]|nr:septum site-determining protein MinC [Steroidobacteraceae bacterium]